MSNREQNQDRIKDVTFIIKTFERFYCVKRLVKSIFKYYPNAKILIADDSEVPCKNYFEQHYSRNKVKVFEVEKDCGLSYGRNYLVKRVKTKYFIVLDDDFVFDKKTDIIKMVNLLEEHNLDILGGYFRNHSTVGNAYDMLKVWVQSLLNYNQPNNYIGHLNFDKPSKTLYADYIRNEFPDYVETDITHNFFVAVTQSILNNNLWDEELKLHEHTAFFLKSKLNNKKVAFSNCASVRHMPVRLKKYSSFRDRNFTKIFMELYGIKKIVSTFDNGEKVIVEYDGFEKR